MPGAEVPAIKFSRRLFGPYPSFTGHQTSLILADAWHGKIFNIACTTESRVRTFNLEGPRILARTSSLVSQLLRNGDLQTRPVDMAVTPSRACAHIGKLPLTEFSAVVYCATAISKSR